MTRTLAFRAVLPLVLSVASAVSMASSNAVAEDKALLRLRAWAVNLNTGARTNTIDIVIERWSTDEEVEKLRTILIEKGGDDLLPAVQKIKPRCGYVRTSNSLGWDLQFARQTELENGARKIVVGTDRPIAFWEARNNPRSRDYEFSLAEIRLPKEGKGQGKAITMAKLSYNKDTNTLEVENYQREPVRLNEITIEK
jgi:hypothetical protein